MGERVKQHMAFYENGDYSMCDCSIADTHNIEDVPLVVSDVP